MTWEHAKCGCRKWTVHRWKIHCPPTQRYGEHVFETWTFFFLSPPLNRVKSVKCSTLIFWWSKRLKATYEQTWMSGVFLPASGPQKNWGAFLIASFLHIFCVQIFLNKFWPWLFGRVPGKPAVRVARCAKPYCPFNRKGVSLGRMGGRHTHRANGLTWHTHKSVLSSGIFMYMLDVCDMKKFTKMW